MKVNKTIIGIAILALAQMFVSCERSDSAEVAEIEGTYEGSFTRSISLGNGLTNGTVVDHGIADVTLVDSARINVHCIGDELDTTLILDIFHHHDSILVCLTGRDFETVYGHSYDEHHGMGGMMDDMKDGETEWMHHIRDEHPEGDEHFGGFDMHEGTFTYVFSMGKPADLYYLRFEGKKRK